MALHVDTVVERFTKGAWPCRLPLVLTASDAFPGAAQEFGHPQARFLHEKRWHLPGGAQAALQPLLGAVNRATFVAIDSAMFIGTVGCLVHAVTWDYPQHTLLLVHPAPSKCGRSFAAC